MANNDSTKQSRSKWTWIERFIWLFMLALSIATSLVAQKFRYENLKKELDGHTELLKKYSLEVFNEKLTNVENGLEDIKKKQDKFVDDFNQFTTDFWKSQARRNSGQ